ncbi:MAG: type IX secretion system membrane protein PorP/SprF [Bacteroidota bacterium]
MQIFQHKPQNLAQAVLRSLLIGWGLIGAGASGTLQAQYTDFAQPVNVPLYYNPGFAGALSTTRVGLTYRNNTATLRGLNTFYGACDWLSDRLRGGIGVEAYRFTYGPNQTSRMHNTRFSAIYAPKFRLRGSWTLSPALKAGFHAYEFTNLAALNAVISVDTPRVRRHGIGLNPAVLLNSANAYLGVSAEWINGIAFFDERQNDPLPPEPGVAKVRWNLQGGYRWEISAREKMYLSATGLASLDSLRNHFLLQLTGEWRGIILGGGWARVQGFYDVPVRSIIGSIGIRHRRFRIMGVVRYDNPGMGNVPFPVASADFALSVYLPRRSTASSGETLLIN